jgi:Asp-tRNA(Asn)/Glu-tRNA(Gln) amidotransferase A subunit family amidase
MRSRRKLKSPTKKAAKKPTFPVEEATIAGIHRAFRAKKLTATELVNRYLARIKAYNGVCVRGDIDAATGLQLETSRRSRMPGSSMPSSL